MTLFHLTHVMTLCCRLSLTLDMRDNLRSGWPWHFTPVITSLLLLNELSRVLKFTYRKLYFDRATFILWFRKQNRYVRVTVWFPQRTTEEEGRESAATGWEETTGWDCRKYSQRVRITAYSYPVMMPGRDSVPSFMFSPLGISSPQTAPSHTMPDVHPPRFWSSFCPCTFCFRLHLIFFRMCPYQRNLPCLAFSVIFSTPKFRHKSFKKRS